MADTDLAPALAPAERGALSIRQRAVEHIAIAATLSAAGVQRHGSSLGRIAGRDLPRAHVEVAGDHVRADVEIAVRWGRSLVLTADAVRRGVTDALSLQGGLTVDKVTVHVADVIAPGDGQATGRSVQ